MKRNLLGVLLMCWLVALVARAQDDVDALIAPVLERYQAGDAVLIYTPDADQGDALVKALADKLPDADVTLQTDNLALPEIPARVIVLVPDKATKLPEDTGTRYGLTERAENDTSVILVYRRTPALLQPLTEFGDSVVLMGWKITRNARVHPCDVLTFSSWWEVTGPVPVDYSMTFALNPTDQDDGIARIDGAPANSQMRLWQPGNLFYDERELTIPCDAPAGDYYLVAGVYDWTNNESLYVMPDEGMRTALMAVRITDD